ncbi:hypothetical protein CLV88_1172 [Shimia abyssi]|uniref:Uncharacterized protein n=1 Tax=Shimia abyssi TaxID=1662395 RepID=A0A2P8F6U7_9RHOB|nr:hypothetical protein CLV88_1172 [Shimia abyssi]
MCCESRKHRSEFSANAFLIRLCAFAAVQERLSVVRVFGTKSGVNKESVRLILLV